MTTVGFELPASMLIEPLHIIGKPLICLIFRILIFRIFRILQLILLYGSFKLLSNNSTKIKIKMKNIINAVIIFSIISLVAFINIHSASADGSPLQISPSHSSVSCSLSVFYNPATYSFDYNGATVTLAGAFDGTGDVYTDDQVNIEVTHPDSTKSTFNQDYGSTGTIVQTTPQDVTDLFKTGTNSVKITMTNLKTPDCGSSAYWLVETTSGGGTIPAKPNILPRSTWHGENNGQIEQQTPNHIVIHHTRTTNDPGNYGTRARELKLAWEIDKIGTVQNRFNPVNILNKKGDYSSIRDTWPGEIWLVWAEHKLIKDYGDIGYQYLVDPQGNIYEGRWKGGLGENADNKGRSVDSANTGIIGISVLGRYGIDENQVDDRLIAKLDGGAEEPTNASIQSVQNLIDWLGGKYGISKTGSYQIPPAVNEQPSCKLSPDLCFVDNIAGHRDFPAKTQTSHTVCPGDNLYKFLPKFRGISSLQATGTGVNHTNPSGILIGGFSPIVLGVVDPSGNRLGIDPATGQYVTNITNGVYGRLGLFDNEDDSISDSPYWLHVPAPTSGVYKIDVVGTDTGSFTLATEDLQTSSAKAINGSTTNGEKDNYQIIYSTENPEQLELFHDTTPPVTTGTMTCSRDMNGTCRSAATVNLAATDTGTNGDPASGVAKIECSYDNKATWQQCGDVNGAQITINKNGKTSFYYRSIDRVLNVEAPKYSGIIDVEQFVSIADTTLKSYKATGLEMTGIAHSNGSMSFTYNTTVRLDILTYIGSFTQSGNTTFTYNQKNQVTQIVPLPSYPLSFYKSKCTNYNSSITLWNTGTTFNKCIYATGNVTIYTTNTKGKLTVISEGYIYDYSTGANIQAWDSSNGILFYSAKGYTAKANGATYTGVIYAPTTVINGGLSNSTLNGALYSKNVNFNSGTSLKAYQAAGFPPTTYNLPL